MKVKSNLKNISIWYLCPKDTVLGFVAVWGGCRELSFLKVIAYFCSSLILGTLNQISIRFSSSFITTLGSPVVYLYIELKTASNMLFRKSEICPQDIYSFRFGWKQSYYNFFSKHKMFKISFKTSWKYISIYKSENVSTAIPRYLFLPFRIKAKLI